MLYSFIIGMSLTASFYMMTESAIPFSLFPLLTLFFSINHFYRIYMNQTKNEKVISTTWISFFIGVFFYAALTGAAYPELGSNFFSVMIALILGIWLIYVFIFSEKK